MKRTLSAKDPVINAGVITANFIWNNANSRNGIVEQGFYVVKCLNHQRKILERVSYDAIFYTIDFKT